MPPGRDVVVIESGAVIVMLSAFVAALLFASFTCTVMLLVPVPVGVPVIAPELAFSDNPAGKVPTVTDQVYGGVPPVAASVAL